MSESSKSDTKLVFRVPEDDGTEQVETVWATALGDDQYVLENTPFYAYSVSWQDIVYAPFDEDEERPTFQRVVSKSGNRTVRVLFESAPTAGDASQRIVDTLVSMGCSYEGAFSVLYAVNLPPGVELAEVCRYLVEVDATWEHADPAESELCPEDC